MIWVLENVLYKKTCTDLCEAFDLQISISIVVISVDDCTVYTTLSLIVTIDQSQSPFQYSLLMVFGNITPTFH